MIFKKKQSVDSLGKVKGNENQGFEPSKHEIQDKVEIIKQNQDSGKAEQNQDGGELLFGHCENNKECKEKETKGDNFDKKNLNFFVRKYYLYYSLKRSLIEQFLEIKNIDKKKFKNNW